MFTPMSTRTFIGFSNSPDDFPAEPETTLDNGDTLFAVDTAAQNTIHIYSYDKENKQWREV